MTRILWLVFERLPHPDAVSFPAGEDDVRLVLELLEHPYPKRLHISGQLHNFLKRQATLPLSCRNTVPCRRASGLYHLVPWRLAKWLSKVLVAEDAVVAKTGTRIRTWLDHHDESHVVTLHQDKNR